MDAKKMDNDYRIANEVQCHDNTHKFFNLCNLLLYPSRVPLTQAYHAERNKITVLEGSFRLMGVEREQHQKKMTDINGENKGYITTVRCLTSVLN
jgi:hypothetical protein